jgi:hypothetical protein
MPTTIKLKNSVTTTNAPSSLAQGEVAINVTDKKVWVGNAATTPIQLLGTGSDGSFTNISVSGVASFADGTVSLPSITNIGDTNTGIFFPAADTIAFSEGGVESVRITDTGNVGIGTSSPSVRLHANVESSSEVDVARFQASNGADVQFLDIGADATNNLVSFDVTGSSSGSYVFRSGGSERMRIDSSGNVGIGLTSSPLTSSSAEGVWLTPTDGAVIANNAAVLSLNRNGTGGNDRINLELYNNGTLRGGVGTLGASDGVYFTTGSTERMRIDSSGNLLVGTTSQTQSAKLTVNGAIAGSGYQSHAGSSGAYQSNVFNFNWTGSPALWVDSTNLGNIQLSSDYRVKKNIQTQTAPALERVMALRPVTYQMADYGTLFKASEEVKEGFIAHEVQEVIPSGAEGVKDAENQIQSLRVDAILAVAVKAIQEQQAIITDLKARIETLESK